MTSDRLGRINTASFLIGLASIVSTVFVGLLGIGHIIPSTDGTLWRALGTCGVIFVGSVASSLAIRCFKCNE